MSFLLLTLNINSLWLIFMQMHLHYIIQMFCVVPLVVDGCMLHFKLCVYDPFFACVPMQNHMVNDWECVCTVDMAEGERLVAVSWIDTGIKVLY